MCQANFLILKILLPEQLQKISLILCSGTVEFWLYIHPKRDLTQFKTTPCTNSNLTTLLWIQRIGLPPCLLSSNISGVYKSPCHHHPSSTEMLAFLSFLLITDILLSMGKQASTHIPISACPVYQQLAYSIRNGGCFSQHMP